MIRDSVIARNVKIPEQALVPVLRIEAGVGKEAAFVLPFLQAAIIKHLLAILNDEGGDAETQTLLEGYEPADSAVSVLEWVYRFKVVVKLDNVMDIDVGEIVIIG